MEAETSLLVSESVFVKIASEGCSLSSNYMDSNDDLRNELRSLSWDQLITLDLEESYHHTSSVADVYERVKLTKDEAFKLLNMAAMLLQRNIRRYFQQKKYRDFLLAYKSAVKIQSAWRGYRTRNLDLRVVKLKHDYMAKKLQTQMRLMKVDYESKLDEANKDKSLLIQIVSILSMELEKIKDAMDDLKISNQATTAVSKFAVATNSVLCKDPIDEEKAAFYLNNPHLHETDSGINMVSVNESDTEKKTSFLGNCIISGSGTSITASTAGSDLVGNQSLIISSENIITEVGPCDGAALRGNHILQKDTTRIQFGDTDNVHLEKHEDTLLHQDHVPVNRSVMNDSSALINVSHNHDRSTNTPSYVHPGEKGVCNKSASSSIAVEEYIDDLLHHIIASTNQTLDNTAVDRQPASTNQTLDNTAFDRQPASTNQTFDNTAFDRQPASRNQTLDNTAVDRQPASTNQTLDNTAVDRQAASTNQTLDNTAVDCRPASTNQTFDNTAVDRQPASTNQTLDNTAFDRQPDRFPLSDTVTLGTVSDPIQCRTPSVVSHTGASSLEADGNCINGPSLSDKSPRIMKSLSDKSPTMIKSLSDRTPSMENGNSVEFLQADSVEFLNDSLLIDDGHCIRDTSADSLGDNIQLLDPLQADSLQFVSDSLQVD